MITERLKIETKENHDYTEEIGYSKEIMSRTLNIEQYKELIAKQYVIHKYLEEQISQVQEINALTNINLSERSKLPLLENDLKILSVNDADKYNVDTDFKISNLNQALGAMYVIEGSTLGGSIIIKTLKRNDNLESIESFNYYGCYGEEVRNKWMEFQSILIDNAKTTDDENEIVEAAKKTFDFYSYTFKQ